MPLGPKGPGGIKTCTCHKVLLQNGANVDGDMWSMSNLHFAAEDGYINIVELLIQNGANVNFLDEERQTPFHGAVLHNRADVVRRFFELGTNFDLNNRNMFGNTAFEDAVEKKELGGILKMMMYHNH